MWTETYNFYTQGFIAFLPPLVGLLITLFGVYGIWITRKEQKSGEQKDGCVMPFLFVFIAFGLLWTIGVGQELGSKYFNYRSALNDHRYQEVEGVVENYGLDVVGMQFEEAFTVQCVEFHYSPYALFGFRKTQRRGGPLDDGVYVRIQYYEGKILRLWIRA